MTVRIDPFLDAELARVLVGTLRDTCGCDCGLVLAGSAVDVWQAEAEALGVRIGTAPCTIGVLTTPDVLDDERRDGPEVVEALVGSASVAVLATLNPAGATEGSGRWPAYWTDLFSAHGWRFIDVLRPVVWDDPRFGPDAKEGWLLFAAPGALPQLSASVPTAMLHPHRIVAAVRGVHAELDALRASFLDGVRTVAQRQELEEVRRDLDAVRAALEAQRRRQLAAEGRLATTERRSVLLMEQQLGVGPLGRATAQAPSGERRLEKLRRFVTGRRTVAAAPDVPPVTPAVVALFDAAYYCREHPEAGAAPLSHYFSTGESFGFRPNPWFDPLFYKAENPDVAQAGVSPLMHFADYGGVEGRAASAEFDTAWYVATYPEVAQSGLNPLLHHMAVGSALGHRTSADAEPSTPAT